MLSSFGSTAEQRERAEALDIEKRWEARWRGADGHDARYLGIASVRDFAVFCAVKDSFKSSGGVPVTTVPERIAASLKFRTAEVSAALANLERLSLIRIERGATGGVRGYVPTAKSSPVPASRTVAALKAATPAPAPAPKPVYRETVPHRTPDVPGYFPDGRKIKPKGTSPATVTRVIKADGAAGEYVRRQKA